MKLAIKKSMAVKSILSSIILVLVTALSLVIVSYSVSSKIVTNEINQQLEAKLEKVKDDVILNQEKLTNMLVLLGKVPSIKGITRDSVNKDSVDKDSVTNLLTEVQEGFGNQIENMYIINANGSVVANYGSNNTNNIKLSNRDYFKESIKGNSYWSEVLTSDFTGNLVQACSSPIYDDNKKIVGVIAATVNFKYITNILEQVKIGEEGNMYLVDKEGKFIYDTDENLIGTYLIDLGAEELNQLEVDKMVNGKSGELMYTYQGKEKLNMYIPLNNWSLSLNAIKKEYLAPLNTLRNELLLMGIIIMILVSIIAGFNSIIVTKNIKQLMKVIKDAAKGNLSVEVKEKKLQKCWQVNNCNKEECIAYGNDDLKCWEMSKTLCDGLQEKDIIHKNKRCRECQVYEVSEGDEIQQIGRRLNLMLTSFKNTVKDIKQVALVLEASSQELSSASEESSVTSEEIAKNINQITVGAEKEVDYTSNTNLLVQQMNVLLDETVSTTKQMSIISEDVELSATEGQQIIQNTITQMNTIKISASKTLSVIDSLNKKSDEIGEINEIITNIADQTNLLALNAAIEAARAGEMGKGFAVVADEIRKLASQSVQSAEGIQQLINNIQEEIKGADLLISEENQKVDEGINSVEYSKQAFTLIVNQIKEVITYINEVASKVAQTKESSNQVSTSVEKVINTAEKSAQRSEEVLAITEEQTSVAEEIASSADQLASMSEDLINSISKFKME